MSTHTSLAPAPGPPKPRLRGRFHQVAFFASIPAGLLLLAVAPTWLARLAALIYALSVSALFGVSAAYHRGGWSLQGRERMKQLDHSMIFVLIAGTYTPVALLAIGGVWGSVILAVVWAGAALGAGLKVFALHRSAGVTATLYIVLGWMAVLVFPLLVRALSPLQLVLTVLGGALYTVGAVVLLRNRPDPKPNVFGYHEIWHLLVIAAAACHYVVVFQLVSAAG